LHDFRYASYHCIVFAYAAHGSLDRYLAPPNRPYLPVDQARSVAAQVLQAVAHVHAKGIVHCDIKLANILVHAVDARGPRVWLCDFGLARDTADAAKYAGTVGTELFRAPESYIGFGFTEIVDEFAAGVVIYRALVGLFPFRTAEGWSARRLDALMQRPEWRGPLAAAKKCVWKLLDADEATRIAAANALKDEWLQPLAEEEIQTEAEGEECGNHRAAPPEAARSLFAQ
jgi:serine/threonine protein kinase